jgi:DNA polymerase-3 subunit gamma/tau
LRDALFRATGERWLVERGEGEGTPTLREQAETAKAAEADRIRNNPLVAAAFAAFPDAELVADDEPPQGDRNWSRRA